MIAPSDRTDLIPGLMLAHQSGTFPTLAGILLTGGYELPETIRRLTDGVPSDLPIALTDLGTFTTAERLLRVRGPMSKDSPNKIETARRLFAEQVDRPRCWRAIDVSASEVRTPLMFEHQLMERARTDRKHIVLPEAGDDRILTAADILLRRGVADLTLLGDENTVRARGSALGLDLDAARVLSPTDPALVERFAAAYAQARAHKGMTLERAREVVTDVSYFGTMMVHLGLADGMVSGAVHTTAHTIRPALEFVKTRPGVSTVSSVFLMCLADRVLVYGDCAVIPEPTTEQLADIAISSAATARQFGIDPRVAMLSYSTGSSGSGADVEKVRAATALVAERAPDLALEGPDPVRRRRRPGRGADQAAGLRGRRARDGLRLPGPQHGQQHLQGRPAQRPRGRDRPGAAGPQHARSTTCPAERWWRTSSTPWPSPPSRRRTADGARRVRGAGPRPQRRVVLAEVPGGGPRDRRGAGQGPGRADRRGRQRRRRPRRGDDAWSPTELRRGRRRPRTRPPRRRAPGRARRPALLRPGRSSTTRWSPTSATWCRSRRCTTPGRSPASRPRAPRSTSPQVAVFDTAFFTSLPPAASTYAIPKDLARTVTGVRRYGFHGTSHRYVSRAVADLPRPAAGVLQPGRAAPRQRLLGLGGRRRGRRRHLDGAHAAAGPGHGHPVRRRRPGGLHLPARRRPGWTSPRSTPC